MELDGSGWKWMEVDGRCVPSSRFRQLFGCSNSTVGRGGIQRDGNNSLGMEELGKFVGIFGELGLDLWIFDRREGSDIFIFSVNYVILCHIVECCGVLWDVFWMFWDVIFWPVVDLWCSGEFTGFCREASSAKPTPL